MIAWTRTGALRRRWPTAGHLAMGVMVRFLRRKITVWALVLAVLSPVAACGSFYGLSAPHPRVDFGKETVVVLHGLGRSAASMWVMASQLEEAGFQVLRVDYPSLRKTPDEILAIVAGQLEDLQIHRFQTVHFVGHSLGGLLIRAYLTDHHLPNLGRVVVVGAPSAGTAMVDNSRHKWWFEILGPTAEALGTGPRSFPRSIGPPDYPLGVIAGRTDFDNDDLLPGEDDGLVAVESTRVEGMADFVVVESSHWAMRYDADVVRHIASFLRTGRFDR